MAENPPGDLGLDDRRDRKRPYETPRLCVYGNITAVTKAVGMSGMDDGGTMANRRTQA